MHSCVGEKWGLLDAPQFVMTVGPSVDRLEANSEAHYIVGRQCVLSEGVVIPRFREPGP